MIRLIAAIDQRRGIAMHGTQPWQLPTDERYFNKQTTAHGAEVLMGRRTFEVIGHPLANRHNYVLSHQPWVSLKDVELVTNLNDFLAKHKLDLWVIGGASLYEQTLDSADELYLTLIEADFNCDKFFPAYAANFRLQKRSRPQEENGLIFTYAVYTKR